jgi:hypothetical protein
MPRTQRLIVASLVLVLGLGFGLLLFAILTMEKNTTVDYGSSPMVPLTAPEREFKVALDTAMHTEEKETAGGYTPDMLMAVLPRLLPEDFAGVSAVIGQYEYKDGQLTYTNNDVVDGAADNLSDEGMHTLRNNIYRRLNLSPDKSAAEVLQLLKVNESATSTPVVIPPATLSGTVCPQDAKICPDGSSVGRTGLNCDFAACPTGTSTPKITSCTDKQRNLMCTEQYQPVCASYQVQCIKAPCNPVPKTYGNSCAACSDKNVSAYTEGQCVINAS